MNLRIFESPEELHRAVARTLVQRIAGRQSASIAISGGSTPKPLYTMLGAPPWREELAKTAITWVVVDERYVPIDDPQSNAGMIEKTLFAQGISPSHRFLRFHTELHDPARTAAVFEEEWKLLLRRADVSSATAADETSALHIVMLGVGDDGHTASLFPGTPVLDVEDRIASEVFVPRLDAWRVTITKPVIRAAGVRLVLAPGKQKVIEEVRAGARHPIALVTEGVETWWYV
ncbi:MAG TPA: 6-phosphogluconolactonase [Thermoanaerobaculia bacterium]|nr:6-phosphogluconolactonase [Thermoanaerobaculia bacterium]